MEVDKAFLVVLGALAIVVLINGILLLALFRSNISDQFKVVGKAINIIRNPWQKEDDDLDELRHRIKKLDNQKTKESQNER